MPIPTSYDLLTQIAGSRQIFLRVQDETTGAVSQSKFKPSDYDGETAIEQLRASSEKGVSVWAMVSASDGQDRPVETSVVWADMDIKNYPGGLAQIQAHIARLPVEPSCIVNSGHGYHVYYFLDQAHAPAVVEPYAKALQWMLGADAAWSANKKMRVPGTINPKYLSEKGQKEGYTTPEECFVVGGNSARIPLLTAPGVETLTRLKHSTMKMLVNGPEVTSTEDRSAYDYRMVRLLNEAGLKYDEIFKLMMTFPSSGKANTEGSNKTHYVEVTLKSALSAQAVAGGFKSSQKEVSSVSWNRKTYQELLDAPRPGFIVNDFLPHAGLALIAAPPKARKSWAAMQLAYSLASGVDWLGFRVEKKRRVLYVQAELPDHIVAARFEQMYGRAAMDNLGFIRVPAADLTLKEHLAGLTEAITDFAAEMVIIDPVANFWQGDENAASSVNALFDNLAQIQELGCAVVLVHHTRKTQGFERLTPQHMRGSSVFFARPDAVMTISPTEHNYSWGDFTLRAAAPRDGVQLFVEDNGCFSLKGVVKALGNMTEEAMKKAREFAANLRKAMEEKNAKTAQPTPSPAEEPAHNIVFPTPDVSEVPEFRPKLAGHKAPTGVGVPEVRGDSPAGPPPHLRGVLRQEDSND